MDSHYKDNRSHNRLIFIMWSKPGKTPFTLRHRSSHYNDAASPVKDTIMKTKRSYFHNGNPIPGKTVFRFRGPGSVGSFHMSMPGDAWIRHGSESSSGQAMACSVPKYAGKFFMKICIWISCEECIDAIRAVLVHITGWHLIWSRCVSNGNIFRVNGHLWGESTGYLWLHKGQSFDKHRNKWLANNRDTCDLRRHDTDCDTTRTTLTRFWHG